MVLPLLAAAVVPALTKALVPIAAQAFGEIAQKLLKNPDPTAEAKLTPAEKRELERLRFEQRMRDMV